MVNVIKSILKTAWVAVVIMLFWSLAVTLSAPPVEGRNGFNARINTYESTLSRHIDYLLSIEDDEDVVVVVETYRLIYVHPALLTDVLIEPLDNSRSEVVGGPEKIAAVLEDILRSL